MQADRGSPMYVLEVGAGHGKLGYLILHHLYELREFWCRAACLRARPPAPAPRPPLCPPAPAPARPALPPSPVPTGGSRGLRCESE